MVEDMILDIGCGHRPHGHVNVDLYAKATWHRSEDRFPTDRSLIKKRIKNLVTANAHHLPFKDNTFSTVFSRNTIEHVTNPVKMIKEMLRVSKHEVIIVCPHRYSDAAKSPPHHNFFNIKWFLYETEKLGYYCKVETTKWRYFPHIIFPLFQLPREIKVTIFKGPIHTKSTS